jgi:hypothetical protein
MLIDTRGPEPDPDRSDPPWWVTLPWTLRWWAVVTWLFLACLMTSGWLSVGFIYAALCVSVWRGSKAIPVVGGLKDYRQ